VLAARSGVGHLALYSAVNAERDEVRVRVARAVRDVFDRLWDEVPPESDQRQRIAASRARRRARALGWPLPLDLDEDTVDDPTAPDPARGGAEDTSRTPFDLDEWLHLVNAGEDHERAAARLGVTFGYVHKRAAELGREDVLFLIRERNLLLKPLRSRRAS
jgi:hypothetical protein